MKEKYVCLSLCGIVCGGRGSGGLSNCGMGSVRGDACGRAV